MKRYGMLVIAGAEVTQNVLRGRNNSHIVALDITKYISAVSPRKRSSARSARRAA